jgi:hypothetical protein
MKENAGTNTAIVVAGAVVRNVDGVAFTLLEAPRTAAAVVSTKFFTAARSCPTTQCSINIITVYLGKS